MNIFLYVNEVSANASKKKKKKACHPQTQMEFGEKQTTNFIFTPKEAGQIWYHITNHAN